MLNILFFILKLIGIILAFILGIFIVLLLIVLFVPIRYRIDGKKFDTISLDAKIGWLLRILYCHIIYIDNKLSIQLRIFGKLFYDNKNDNNNGNNLKKHKKKVRTRKRKAKRRNEENAKKIPNDSNPTTIPDNKETKLTDSDSRLESDRYMDADRYMDPDRYIDTESYIDTERQININSQMDIEKHLDADSHMDVKSYMDNGNGNNSDKDNAAKDEKLDSENIQKENQDTISSNRKSRRFFKNVKRIIARIKHFFVKLKERIVNFFDFIKNIKSKVSILWNKWEKIKVFYNNETNKAGIKKIWISIKKLVRHIYPTKLRIELEYGTGDPCETGQALGIIATFYGYYGKSIKIIPNFETEIFEGTLYCKGRIRLFTLLIISIKLILDKNFRKLIQNFNSIKEEL